MKDYGIGPRELISACAASQAAASASSRVLKLMLGEPVVVVDGARPGSMMVYSQTHVQSACWPDRSLIDRPSCLASVMVAIPRDEPPK